MQYEPGCGVCRCDACHLRIVPLVHEAAALIENDPHTVADDGTLFDPSVIDRKSAERLHGIHIDRRQLHRAPFRSVDGVMRRAQSWEYKQRE
jgi:hypothetical protein